MIGNLEAFEDIRATIQQADALIRDRRTGSGTRKRATRVMITTALEAIDLAEREARRVRAEQTDQPDEDVLIWPSQRPTSPQPWTRWNDPPATRSRTLPRSSRRSAPVPAANQVVLSNRKIGPELVIDIVAERAPTGFDRLDDVISHGELLGIAMQYRKVAGFDREQLAGPKS